MFLILAVLLVVVCWILTAIIMGAQDWSRQRRYARMAAARSRKDTTLHGKTGPGSGEGS
jgi:ABC-type Fe3+ transport system permease subunit